MVNAKPAEAEAGVRKLYTDGAAFLTTSAGVTSYVNVPDQGNPMYEYNIRRLNSATNLRASNTFMTWLQTNNDPRRIIYFGTATNNIHQGDFNATNASQPTYATAAVYVQAATDPVFFISAAESYFMQAEANLRYGVGPAASVSYNNGVNAAFAQVGATRGALYPYPAGTFDQNLEAIIVQKWASMPGSHAIEAFFEQERTGYPKISPTNSKDVANYIPGQWSYSISGVTANKAFPKRMVFPDSERSRNKNTPAEVPITTPVWWGK